MCNIMAKFIQENPQALLGADTISIITILPFTETLKFICKSLKNQLSTSTCSFKINWWIMTYFVFQIFYCVYWPFECYTLFDVGQVLFYIPL